MNGPYHTQAALAEACGVSAQSITNWSKEDDYPVGKSGPWTHDDVLALKAWRQTRRLDPNAPNVRMVDMRLKAERMLKVKLEREILSGHYVPLQDVKNEWGNMTRAIRGAMVGVGAAVAARWPGPDAGRLQEIIDLEIAERLRRYASEGLSRLDAEEAANAAA